MMSTAAKEWPEALFADMTILCEVNEPEKGTVRALSKQHANPANWQSHVEKLLALRKARNINDRCILCRRPFSESASTSEEHVILQGLGSKWAKLPSGVVCDADNNSCSAAELQLLRSGALGALRPFYVNSKKRAEFEAGTKKIVFESKPNEPFRIEVHGFPPDVLPDSIGSSEISFTLPVTLPDTTLASRALHKIAYLCLATLWPEFALADEAARVRAYIADANNQPYRAYTESFVPGAHPGVEFRCCSVVSSVNFQEPFSIERLEVALRLHHVSYHFALVGEHKHRGNGHHHLSAEPERKNVYQKISFRIAGAQAVPISNSPLQTDRPSADH